MSGREGEEGAWSVSLWFEVEIDAERDVEAEAEVGSSGKIGPNLDNLPADAERAGQPVEAFIRASIVNPDAYIEKGFPKGVMPKSYKALPPNDLNALVDFLTKPQG